MKLTSFHISIPKQGETLSGDAAIIRSCDGIVLLAVIDALGHGPLAAAVADKGCDYLLSAQLNKGVRPIMEGLHDALRGPRGAAAMCCVIAGDRLEGCGVGNVEMRVVTSRIPVVLTPGIVGVRHQPLRVFEGALVKGTRILMFSDGVSSVMSITQYCALQTEAACRAMMERYRRPQDDAILLIVDAYPPVGEGAFS